MKYSTVLATAGLVALMGLGGAALAAGGPPFGDKASVSYSKALWTAMKKARLVGANSVRTRPYEGTEPHGAILETLDTTISVNGHKGVVIIKKNFGPAGISVEDVANNPARHIKAVTVMFKREKGYDSENKNWFWAKFKPDGSLHMNPKKMMLAGRVAKGADKGCIACHKGADGEDMVFNTNRIR
jgi:hypothetical protein